MPKTIKPFGDAQKRIINDIWQLNAVDLFPHKPDPKVYLDPFCVKAAIASAVDGGYTKEEADLAMFYWRRGKRWNEAQVLHEKILAEKKAKEETGKKRRKEILKLLAADFPGLFGKLKEVRLLRIGIFDDLKPWATEHQVSDDELKNAIRYWVSRKAYRILARSLVKEGVKRYGLDMQEYDAKEKRGGHTIVQ